MGPPRSSASALMRAGDGADWSVGVRGADGDSAVFTAGVSAAGRARGEEEERSGA